jgi:outer membrane protein assembly factor BamB
MSLTRRVLLFVIFVLITSRASAQDWSQWRGPARDGVAAGFVAPKVWPEQLKLKWKMPVGEGHSSPVVGGSRVYQLSRVGEREFVTCLELETGKIVWQDSYDVNYKLGMTAAVIVGKHKQGPRSTPVLMNGRLYTFGVGGMLSCYDAGTGKLAWRKEFSKQFKNTAPEFGASMSPLVDRGLLLVHVGGEGQGAFTAFDAKTGDVKWSWTGDGPAYASPVVGEFVGKRHVVTQSQKNVIGLWADNGGLLWQMPFTTEYEQNSVTPLVYKDTIILSGINKGVFAVRPAWRNSKWEVDQVWKNDEVAMYMNSPVLKGNLLFGFSHKQKGQFFCLDAATGKTLWLGAGRQGENAAMVVAGDVIFMLTNEAELIAARASGKGFEQLKRWHVADSETWAHPVIVGNRILVKDMKSLAAYSLE